MRSEPTLTVLCGGGPSAERDVSLVSGRSIAKALAHNFEVELMELNSCSLPDSIDPEKTVIFPAFHGAFGEDGTLQLLLDDGGFCYAGSGADASRLCMNKFDTKQAVRELNNFSLAQDFLFDHDNKPTAKMLTELLGARVVIKPVNSGSSVDLFLIENNKELVDRLSALGSGHWLTEKRIEGREMSIGVLDGKAMGVVEIIPQKGVYDYHHKYTPGCTTYHAPADIPESLAHAVCQWTESVFAACGCRDFARLDFILTQAEEPYFLEINTIPGLTETSLLPKSAGCLGHDFVQLAQAMAMPAVDRFAQQYKTI